MRPQCTAPVFRGRQGGISLAPLLFLCPEENVAFQAGQTYVNRPLHVQKSVHFSRAHVSHAKAVKSLVY